MATAERDRLDEADARGVPWRRWGPYLSERQWGTVREDTTEGGDSWSAFTHDQARARAHRWGEDGLAGISDDRQLLCLALALRNGQDPVLKKRLFGLSNGAGIGASHQTGWTGLVGVLPPLFRDMDPRRLLARGGGASVPQPRRRPRAQAKAAR